MDKQTNSINGLPFNLEGIFQQVNQDNTGADALTIGTKFHEAVFQETEIPRKVTYREALEALKEGQTVLCKPKEGSSFLADSYERLVRCSGSVDRSVLLTYIYTIV